MQFLTLISVVWGKNDAKQNFEFNIILFAMTTERKKRLKRTSRTSPQSPDVNETSSEASVKTKNIVL